MGREEKSLAIIARDMMHRQLQYSPNRGSCVRFITLLLPVPIVTATLIYL